MGQYYSVAFKQEGAVKVSSRRVRGKGYMMAKLLEHSYLENSFCKAVAKAIFGKPARIAWVGDYAEEDEVTGLTKGDVTYADVWGTEDKEADDRYEFAPAGRFSYRGKWLVNHDKKVCISFDAWKKGYGDENDWPIFPLSLLTAIGNGRGGGDYGGNAMARIGTWTWDLVEITKTKPAGYEVLDFTFHEGYGADEYDEDSK